MVAWETIDTHSGQPPVAATTPTSGRRPTRSSSPARSRRVQRPDRIERDFDPEAVRQLKASAEADLSVGGPGLAAVALRAGLVDECHLFLTPVVVGGGTRALPDHVRLRWSYWTSAASATAWSTSTTATEHEEP